MRGERRWGWWLLALATLAAACSGGEPGGSGAEAADRSLAVEVLSTRPEYVSGGDALVKVSTPDGDRSGLRVTARGRDVTSRFDEDGVALLRGLPEGESTIRAELDGEEVELTVTNHPVTGPLFSGPHLPLEVCTTEAFGLGPAVDDDCSAAEPVTSWRYVTTDGRLRPLPDPTARPGDLATRTVDGRDLPLIVRDEVGTINRAVYFVSVPDPDPGGDWRPSTWNGTLVYRFGGGCGTSYSQGSTLVGSDEPELFAAGYATATATFNTFQTMCNDVLSAETALMVKEHFSEAYAPPERTVGNGGSGGAIQQYLIAQNYPGILDAIAPTLPFPDAVTIASGVTDCGLLQRFHRSDAGAGWSVEQRTAVNGHLTAATCLAWEQTFLRGVVADEGCNLDLGAAVGGTPVETLDPALVYDPEGNPDGLRCTLQDTNVNVFGTDPDTGFARRPLDSVGVQYGLEAFVDGVIDFDRFATLNESIGGYDLDGEWIPERTQADEAAIEVAYATGRVLTGDGPLADTPIITVDVYTDDQGDIHDRFRAFSVDDRLAGEEEADPPANHVIWTRGLPQGTTLVESLSGSVPLGVQLTGALDEWARSVDTGGAVADPPASAVSRCLLPDGEEVVGPDVNRADGPCTTAYPSAGDPRTAAGAPRSNDVLKCALQPVVDAVEAGVYPPGLTPGQVARLEEVFPDGVCDWREPGIGQVPLAGTWLDYSADPAVRPGA